MVSLMLAVSMNRHRLRIDLARLACVSALLGCCSTASAAGARPVKLLKGPYLTGLCETGVDVRFELDGAASAVVEVDGGLAGHTFGDRTASTMHVVRTSGLAPASAHSYTVLVDGRALSQGRFTTAPKNESSAPLKFLVYGDDRTNPTAHAAVVRALAATPSDFLVNTGDMVEDGGRAEDWQSFFDIEAPLLRDRAIFVAIGNHELYDDRAGANFARYLGFSGTGGSTQPYGTVRLGNVRFFFLNSLHDWSSGEERKWLEAELGRADGEPGLAWRIAVMHHGPWSSGPHGVNTDLLKAHVPELLAAHGVDLVLGGHDHIYERGATGGIKYVNSGGGGAPLYRSSKIASTRKTESTYHFVEITTGDQEVRLVARRIDGSVLNQCGFGKGTGWDCDEPQVGVADSNPNTAPGVASASVHAPPLATASSSSHCALATPGSRTRAKFGAVLLAALGAFAVARRKGRRARGLTG